MKKVIYTAIIVTLGMVSLVSCKRTYHCKCSYNNRQVFSKDLGAQAESKAQEMCSSYDTTVPGEIWTCTTY